MLALLRDRPRSGAPRRITLSQRQQIVALACEAPEDFGIEMTQWNREALAQEVAVDKGIVETISPRYVSVVLKKNELQPHKSRYWLNPKIKDWQVFAGRVQVICTLILEVIKAGSSKHLISVDEKTGIQALERIHADQPAVKGAARRLMNTKEMAPRR